jgi:tetratricopeptide (TPR) repeat protein
MDPRPQYADSGVLLSRLVHAVDQGEPVTFLFGSAVTAPGSDPTDLGVPDASALIERVFERFRGTEEFDLLNTTVERLGPSERYQAAMKFVIDCRGPDELNRIIRDAILKARVSAPLKPCSDEDLELDTAGWHLRPAVEAVGQLFSEHPKSFSLPVLTTNFDPLLEISLRKAGNHPTSIFLPADGQFNNVIAPGSSKVVHLHGYWRGSDTLHTPSQLARNRPQLKGSLRSLLRQTTLVVVGYGGWGDVFTSTLVDVINEQTEQLNVIWTFYSNNDDDILRRYGPILLQFEALAGQRVVFYKGIDCHLFLPTLREKLKKRSLPVLATSPSAASPERKMEYRAIAGDHPPQADIWVGRQHELHQMLSTEATVVAITGLGGNGKSTLAAKYIELKKGAADVTAFYWADCKEQRNTLFTQIVRMVERVSDGKVTGSELQKARPHEVIDLLVAYLRDVAALIVFDNIDQYVDVESAKAIETMDMLMRAILSGDHKAQFIFTTRPRLEYSHHRFLQIQLGGLTVDDTRHLLDISGVKIEAAKAQAIAEQLHALTNGHSLALNLIATQVAKNKADLADLMVKLRAGQEAGNENALFQEIWTSLNGKQQLVLRYLAEQTRADPEQRIANYLGKDLNYNQFSKAVKSLKALSLVVVKSPGGEMSDTLELHPLVSDFIRRRFPAEERAPFIDSIIHVCDLMIAKFRSMIMNVPFSVLENWTSKIELCMRRGLYHDALDALYEVQYPLEASGYGEELVRLASDVLTHVTPDQNETDTNRHDHVYKDLVEALAHLGRWGEADAWIDRFQSTVSGKTARFVLLCEMRAYRYWYDRRYESATEWATQGVELKASSDLDTKYDCRNMLALALRDSGRRAEAVKLFLRGEAMQDVVKKSHFNVSRGGAFYGNIGRCLQLDGDWEGALACIGKSAKILETAKENNILMNRGYAAFWIGEIADKRGEFSLSYVAFRRAAAKWKTLSPPRAQEAVNMAARAREKLSDPAEVPVNDWECERAFLEWLEKN